MTDLHKLQKLVARTLELTADEASELRGRNLAELTSHGRHLLGRRDAVDAAKRRNPGMPDYAIANIEGGYDGGGVRMDDQAGKELAIEALRDNVAGRDNSTRGFLANLGRNTLSRRARTEEAEDRKQRIEGRLRDAGYGNEGN